MNKDKNFKIYIEKNIDKMFINFVDNSGNTIICETYLNNFQYDVASLIEKIKVICIYLHINQIDIKSNGEGCDELYNEFIAYLNNSGLSYKIKNDKILKKSR